MADKDSTARSGHSSNHSNVRRSPIVTHTDDPGDFPEQRNFVEVALEDDYSESSNIHGRGKTRFRYCVVPSPKEPRVVFLLEIAGKYNCVFV